MLIQRPPNPLERGFSLIELLVVLAIIGILMTIGLPSFRTWTTNVRLRNAAESIQNGLQLARAGAVQRNFPVRFQLVDTMNSSCALSTTGNNWVVSIDDPVGKCDIAASETVSPRIIQARSGIEASSGVSVSVGQNTVIFNGLGRVTPIPAANIEFLVTNPGSGTCKKDGGEIRCLNIVVTSGGQVRMCDPSLANSLPQGC